MQANNRARDRAMTMVEVAASEAEAELDWLTRCLWSANFDLMSTWDEEQDWRDWLRVELKEIARQLRRAQRRV